MKYEDFSARSADIIRVCKTQFYFKSHFIIVCIQGNGQIKSNFKVLNTLSFSVEGLRDHQRRRESLSVLPLLAQPGGVTMSFWQR